MLYLTYALPQTRVLNPQKRLELLFDSNIEIGDRSEKFFETRTQAFNNAGEIRTNNFYPLDTVCNSSRLLDTIPTDINMDYIQFFIPKHNGGVRNITAPNEQLKEVQRNIVNVLKATKALPHNAAYAYCHGRSAYQALLTHQFNKSRWFLKIDLKDFFPSMTKELITEQLNKLVQFENSTCLSRVLDYCMLDNTLPQGAPTSPILSNFALVEFDYLLTKKISNYNKQRYIYTRYADDILITSYYDFNKEDIIKVVEDTLQEAGLALQINKDKTRYGSNSGRNWNLGLMYNKDMQITIGHKKKKQYHELLRHFCTHTDEWGVRPTQELLGKLNYLKQIEPNYYSRMIKEYQTEFNIILKDLFKRVLNAD